MPDTPNGGDVTPKAAKAEPDYEQIVQDLKDRQPKAPDRDQPKTD